MHDKRHKTNPPLVPGGDKEGLLPHGTLVFSSGTYLWYHLAHGVHANATAIAIHNDSCISILATDIAELFGETVC